MAERIPNTTLSGTFANGEVLHGWQVNKIVEVLKAGVNVNKDDIDKILFGEETDFVFATKELADAYLLENTPTAEQYALVMSGGDDGEHIDVYKYSGGIWSLQVDDDFSILNAYLIAKGIDDRTTQLEEGVPALETKITNGEILFKKIALDETPASTLNIGETSWSPAYGTLITRLTADVVLAHGQELVIPCKNKSGGIIANGTPVYISGASGVSPNFYIDVASNDNYAKTSKCFGLATEEIANDAFGRVCLLGIVNDLDTTSFEVGDIVYLGYGGTLTNVRPTTNVLALGVVIQKNSTTGRIALNPIHFPRPEDLSNITYTSIAQGDVIIRSGSGNWVNFNLTSALSEKADISDLEDGTIIVDKATNDKDGNAIDTTYLKKSGGTMSGAIAMGTNKITGLGDGVDNQDGATMKNIDTKITAHDESETAHLYIRELIQDVETEIARIEGRGKSYGELALKQSELLALEESARNTAIYNDILGRHTSYELANGQLVYTLEDDEENTHEWEYNSTLTTWVDNGAYTTEKASNTNYGLVKGDSTYLSIVSGLVQVLKSDYADKIGTSGGSYTYAQLLSAFNDRYTKAEVDAIIDALKTAYGWEETNIGVYSAPVDLSDYDLVLLKLINTSPSNVSNTQIIRPSSYVTGEYVGFVINAPDDNSILGAGVFEKGTTTWTYLNVSGTNTLTMIGYKIAPIQAENVVYDNSTSELVATDVNGAIDEIKEDLDLKEIASNKVSAFQETPDDSHYASEKLVKDSLDDKEEVSNKATNLDSPDDITYPTTLAIATKTNEMIKNQELVDSVQSKKISDIEETLRKQLSGEVEVEVNGVDIISLGKDVANAPLKVNVEGGLLYAPQLVTNGDFDTDYMGWTVLNIGTPTVTNGVVSFTATAQNGRLISGNLAILTGAKLYYVSKLKTNSSSVKMSTSGINAVAHSGSGNYETISGLATLSFDSPVIRITDERTSDWTRIDVDFAYAFNISTLIAVKLYSPIYDTTFDLMSDAEIKAQMDLWVNNNTLPNDNLMSVSFNKRVRSVGKNLFDGQLEIGSIDANGTNVVDTTRIRSKNYTRISPSTSYNLSIASGTYTLDLRFYDTNKSLFQLQSINDGVSFTTPSNASYLRFTVVSNTNILEPIQLEQGTVATTYEPYVNSDMFLQANALGYKLPNLVRDTIEYKNGKYYYVQRVKKYVLQESDIVSIMNNTNAQAVNFTKPTDFIMMGNNVTNIENSSYLYLSNFEPGDAFTLGLPNTHVNYYLDRYTLLVTLGTYASLAEAKADLAGTVIYYQLTTPIETEILTTGNLIGYENGTVYIDDIIEDADIYSTNATVSNSDYPIKTLDKIIKINADGLQTDIAVSGATVAGDGLSFTHELLTSGDKVWFSYFYDVDDLMKSTSTIIHYDNKTVCVDSEDSKVYKITPSIANGVLTWVLTEV